MRRFIVLSMAVLFTLMAGAVIGGVALAKTGPLLPGDMFFPVQHFAEQTQAGLEGQAENQVEIYFNLVERRVVNLVLRTGTTHESEALQYLNDAIDQALGSWSLLPPDNADSLQPRLLALLSASEMAGKRLELAPTQNPDLIASFLAKISTLLKLAEDPLTNPAILANLTLGETALLAQALPEQVNDPDATIDPLAVPFPPGSLGSEHAFYPLLGQHAQIECTSCHPDGVYVGTPTYCEACHADVQPENHYAGDCAACHSPFFWSDVTFDHTLVTASDCASCHAADKPASHYGSRCAACHSTSAWQPADFNHQAANATNCQSCHLGDKTADHFKGQCSKCHSTNTWKGASFNHSGQTDCKSCHGDDKPSNHFGGQCSACHTSSSWKGASFNHSGKTDCKSCHSGDKPSNHFGGQCSACHSTSSWKGATFNHSGQTDCKSCHSSDKPSNHFGGQCSACHSTSSWKGATFNHSGQTDCKSCHSDDKPSNHFGGQCSACHSNRSWGDASFSHSGQTDCKSCHAGDRPREHDGGQCSACHTTKNWDADEDEEDKEDEKDRKDEEDEKDEEHGSLDLASFDNTAMIQPPVDCVACHTAEKSINETVRSKILLSRWAEYVAEMIKKVAISIG